MANRSMEWYVKNGDFEGAKVRLETTTPCWRKRWYEVCAEIFNKCAEWAKKYVLDPLTQTIHAITHVIGVTKNIYISADCQSLLDDKSEKCYLFEFLDKENKLVCSKVGTTTRTIIKRLSEEITSKTYVNMGVVTAVIRRVYDCGKTPAEGMESYFRAHYIKRYPDSFKKNDRFINVKFDLVEADKIYESYCAI